MKKRLAIIVSHPIQHFCPLYANWAKNDLWEIKVFFASNAGAKPYFDENFKKMITWEGLRLEQFAHEFLNGEQDIPVNASTDASNLANSLQTFAPDAVLTYGYDQRLQRRAKRWAISQGIPVIYFADSELRQQRSIIKQWLKKLWLPYYFQEITSFLVTGNANEVYYVHYGVPQSKMIRSSYPIDRDLYEDAWNNRENLSASIRAKYEIPVDSVVVSMAGKLIDRKRQIDLIHALSKVKNCHITLLLIGTGEKEEAWKIAASEIKHHRIIFAGFIEAHHLPAYYAASDIYAHVSEAEPHSVAVSEAIYMGCPVIISHTCGSYGMDDDVQVGVNGYVFPCKNIDQLAQKIEHLATNYELRNSMSTQSNLIAVSNQRVTHLEVLNTLHRFAYV